jgi:hypothetical protein
MFRLNEILILVNANRSENPATRLSEDEVIAQIQ